MSVKDVAVCAEARREVCFAPRNVLDFAEARAAVSGCLVAGAFCFLLGLMTTQAGAQPLPTGLASIDDTLYRVNGAGLPAGTVQAFPNQPGSIIGMTLVPAGVAVAGCTEGSVLAIEGSTGRRIWRVDGARAGVPHLVQVGQLPPGVLAYSIAFGHGRLFCIADALFSELSPATFQQIGATVDLRPTDSAGTGGLAFDGVGTWYATNSISNRLISLPDPPTAAGWNPILPDVGVDFASNGLEFYAGRLWAALQSPGTAQGRLVVGQLSLPSSQFSQVWDLGPAPAQSTNVGFVAFAPSCLDIAAQPQRAFVCPDGAAVFSITAAGPGPFAYQWRKGGVPIDPALNPSAASSELVIFGVQPSDFGTYDCIVANACGTVRCNPALLTGRLGDADGDGAVGLSDIALMIQNWSDPGEPPVPPGMFGDLTGDGRVQLDDVAIATMNWGESCD